MHRVNEYRFYVLGQKIHNLIKDVKEDTSMADAWWHLNAAHVALGDLLRDPLPLRICRPAAQKLMEAITATVPHDIVELSRNQELGQAKVGFKSALLSFAIRDFEPVLAAECDAMDTYVVSKKGIYSTPDLIESAEQVIPDNIRALIPPQSIRDLNEAGRCLVFALNTACGFHLMRATEAVIHAYYVAATAHDIRRKDRNWGAYVRNLNKYKRDHPESTVDPKLISLIDQLREHHRNVLMHPEESLTADEALGLFGICQSAIVAFGKGIERVTSGGAP